MFGQLSLVIGIALAVGSIILVNLHANSIKKDEKGVSVLRAAAFIPAGTDAYNLSEAVLIPKRLADALDQPVLEKDASLIRDKAVIDNIRGGEFLLWAQFGEGSQGGPRKVIQELTKGKRAMAVPVKFTSAVAGWVRPGDHVDVIATVEMIRDEFPETYTITLLQDMRILAVGWKDRQQEYLIRGRAVDKQAKSVIMEVTPTEAELVNFALTQKADITLTLRTPNDREVEPLPRMNLDVFLHNMERERKEAAVH